MAKKTTVEKWELPEINLDVSDDGDVILVSCKICKGYYVDDDGGREELIKFTGKMKKLIAKWINELNIIKKNNEHEHFQKVKYLIYATRRLKERADTKELESTEVEQASLNADLMKIK